MVGEGLGLLTEVDVARKAGFAAKNISEQSPAVFRPTSKLPVECSFSLQRESSEFLVSHSRRAAWEN